VNRSDELIDYEQLCAVSDERVASIAPHELAQILEKGEPVDLVDVREEYEWNIARIPGARLVPLGRLADEVSSFDSERKTIFYCKTGMRSMRAAEQLVTAGFENVGNLTGGIVRWREEIDPSIPLY
jgi:adenylyltransferase/sulfurtransferase